MNWQDLHQAICTKLKEEISAIQTCEIYPAIRKELVAPAVFVELASLEPGTFKKVCQTEKKVIN
ncbi:hypothetical protein [Wolbachia endosymbiont (group B) of Ochlodes sylvanus]|uniref:hypothetical protein n=1 Tax=Wolbachia endosymbiont (group B) of Ochlodes sylvanus TaxID=2954035 RepID=UPI00221F7EC2|nr:hypothetical protein [Wolbachia endosymbiont (group B) of Ochlodes sylvanus]